jgi:hypothetical protein
VGKFRKARQHVAVMMDPDDVEQLRLLAERYGTTTSSVAAHIVSVGVEAMQLVKPASAIKTDGLTYLLPQPVDQHLKAGLKALIRKEEKE